MKKVVLLVIMSCLGLMAWASVPETRIFNVVDGDTLKMDIYRTPSDNKTLRPAVIFAFGGGFTGGSRDNDEYKEYFDFLCDNEVVVISIDYRTSLVKKAAPGALTSVDGFTASLMTAVTDAVTDFCTATGFVLQHAVEWGIDPDKIVASGSSAGAITALQVDLASRARQTKRAGRYRRKLLPSRQHRFLPVWLRLRPVMKQTVRFMPIGTRRFICRPLPV